MILFWCFAVRPPRHTLAVAQIAVHRNGLLIDRKVLEARRSVKSPISIEKSLRSAKKHPPQAGPRPSHPFARVSRERQSKSPAADSSECLRGFGFSRLGRSIVWISSACHRSTRPIQKALSFALRAAAASRRHSSARRRNSSTITSRPSFGRPTSPPFLRPGIHKLYQIENFRMVKLFARNGIDSLNFSGGRRLDFSCFPNAAVFGWARSPQADSSERKPQGPMRRR